MVDAGYPLIDGTISDIINSHVKTYQIMTKQLLLALLCIGSTLALFADDSAVFKLTASNFKDQVINSDEFWLVEFYGTHSLSQLPGADIAKDRLPSSRRLPRYWMESLGWVLSTWTRREQLASHTKSKATPLSNFSVEIKRNLLLSSPTIVPSKVS